MDMKNILKSFDAASSGKKVGTAGAAKNEMKAILESLQAVQECGMDPMTSMPPAEDKVTMNVNLNARGIDAIDELVRLMGGKAGGDKGADIPPGGLEIPVAVGPKPMDKHDDMARLMAIASAEHGDDEEEMESWDNSPEEEYSDHNTMLKDLSGGINRQKKMFAKAQDGDNAMAVKEEELDELADIKSQLSALWKAKVRALDEADVANPYQGADAEKFAAMSPEDQAWLTKGGGKPDINDENILARAPNGGKPVQKPQANQSGVAGVNAGSQQDQALAAQTAGMSDSGVAGVTPGSQQDQALAAQTAGMDEPAAAAPAAAPAAPAQASGANDEKQQAADGNNPGAAAPAAPAAGGAKPAAGGAKPAAGGAKPAAGGAGKATKADADAMTKAIKDFQSKAGLKADGIVGPQTMAALKAAQSGQAAAPAAGGAKPAAKPAAPAAAPNVGPSGDGGDGVTPNGA